MTDRPLKEILPNRLDGVLRTPDTLMLLNVAVYFSAFFDWIMCLGTDVVMYTTRMAFHTTKFSKWFLFFIATPFYFYALNNMIERPNPN